MKKNSYSLFYNLVGHFFVLLGIVGVFLPILPTTPFMLLALYFYSKGSQRFHTWLIQHKIFGPSLKDWEEHGAISSKAKKTALLCMCLFIGYPLLFLKLPICIKVLAAFLALFGASFILTRPSS